MKGRDVLKAATPHLKYAPITPPKKKMAVTTPCCQADRLRCPPYPDANRKPSEV